MTLPAGATHHTPETSLPTNLERFAIVILSYDHPQLTQKTIESVLAIQETKPSLSIDEVFLVHNGSSKKNRDFLELNFRSNVTHLSLDENRGYSGGANFGLEMALAKYDWVLFITNDCELVQLPQALTYQPGLYAPKILRRKTERVDSIGGICDLSSGRLRHCRTESEFFEAQNTKPTCSTRIYIPGTAFLIDRQSWRNIKGFDERLSTYWEDVDLSLRAQKSNVVLGLAPEFQLQHKVGKTCHHLSIYSLFYYQRNRLWVTRWHARMELGAARQLILTSLLLIDSGRLLARLLSTGRTRTDVQLFLKAIFNGFFKAPAHAKTSP